MRHMSFRSKALELRFPVILIVFLAFTDGVAFAETRPREKPVFATSADDPALRKRIVALSPTVRPDEAQLVARWAYNTGRELKREWRVGWPPGLHNFLVNTGSAKRGTLFSICDGTAAPVGCLETRNTGAPLGGIF